MDCQTITGQTKRRGFNLIEAAIVLGVVGLVIGGIWVAAAAIMESYKINKTLEDIVSINNCISRKFPRLTCDATICNQVNKSIPVKFLKNAGCIPSDMKWKGNYLLNRWGGLLFIEFIDQYTNGLAKPMFWVEGYHAGTQKMTPGQCARILTKIISSIPDTAWHHIQIGPHVSRNPIFDGMTSTLTDKSFNGILAACEAYPDKGFAIALN